MKCGNCGQQAGTVATVKACYAGQTFPCHWLVERTRYWGDDEYGYESEQVVEDCGAHAEADERGWRCEVGHEHVTIEARVAEGWDYAHDSEEAKRLAAAGVDSVGMDGGAVPIYAGV